MRNDTAGDLISRSALKKDLLDRSFFPVIVKNALENAPTVDAVEVVRCKACENRGDETLCPMCYEECYEIDEGDGYYDTGYTLHDRTHDEGFCDRGKRRANDGK